MSWCRKKCFGNQGPAHRLTVIATQAGSRDQPARSRGPADAAACPGAGCKAAARDDTAREMSQGRPGPLVARI